MARRGEFIAFCWRKSTSLHNVCHSFQLPTKNLYYSIYKVALDRFLRYFDKIRSTLTESEEDVRFVENVNRLRTKYGSCPTKLLETFRNETDEFAAILHGDFNRNNVLFKYPSSDINSSISSLQTSSSSLPVPEDVKMIDFQVSSYECSSSQWQRRRRQRRNNMKYFLLYSFSVNFSLMGFHISITTIKNQEQ